MLDKYRKKIGSGHHPTRTKMRKAAVLIHAEGKPVRAAMRDIGYAASTSDKSQTALTQNPIYQEEVQRLKEKMAMACQKHDITVDRLAKKVSDGLEAVQTYKTPMGELVASSLPDHDSQVKWWDRGAQLLGIRKDDAENGSAPINISMLVNIVNQAREARGLAA